MLTDSSPKDKLQCNSDVTHYRRQGNSMLLTVPKSLREDLRWTDGQMLIASAVNGALVVLPVTRQMIDNLGQYVTEDLPSK